MNRGLVLGIALGLSIGANVVAAIHHEKIATLEARIDQLEEDVDDVPVCDPAVEAEDEMLSTNETEI